MPGKTVLVLAGNYREYRKYVQEHQGDGVRYFYARDIPSISGPHPDDLVITGTFPDRKDAQALYDLAKAQVRTRPGSEPQPE